METRFGHDFSKVRIDSSPRAAGQARMLGADAFTIGNRIAFAPGRYAPETPAGRTLLAHELAHVVQHGGRADDRLAAGGRATAPERDAERAATRVSRGEPAGSLSPAPAQVRRSCADGDCSTCFGGRRDFWITVFFRRRATADAMTRLRAEINGAKAILRNCCLDLKFDFDWRLLPGGGTMPAGAARPAGDALGPWDYPAATEAIGESGTFAGARGVPMIVVDDVPGSGGGVTLTSEFDAEYTGPTFFGIALHQPNPNPGCNHIAHELWHVATSGGHDPANGAITACTGNAVSLTYCNALRNMVAPVGDFPLPTGDTRVA
jgi:hypothetical protein